ncbi:MAG TPA: response regulator [Gemmatimonadales bacterium]|nr:response regulator [Gemmatimonadales bacterium]
MAARGADGRPRSVLIVDDLAAVRQATGRLLGAAGYRVFEAGDGAEALEVLQAASALAPAHERGMGGAIDLVLTDVMMPFSGVALGQEIRARWPEQRVLYMSAYPAESLQAEGLRRVDGPFLAKPFTAEELLSAVWAALQELQGAPSAATPPPLLRPLSER